MGSLKAELGKWQLSGEESGWGFANEVRERLEERYGIIIIEKNEGSREQEGIK